ncbi:Dam family site-specific DNA-(adenine-N6)-methyltransferase [Salmonella enterica]|nr:Dam family site-specific DNA-(adenine-N6)-methyltransferase [Salmonella enterica]
MESYRPEGETLTQPIHRPVLKWAGGKTKLMPFIRARFPRDDSRRWVEPFIGAGSVFLNMFVREGVLSDSNKDLINFYQCIQTNKVEFIDRVQLLAAKPFSEEDYYKLRADFNASEDEMCRAVQFYALNRLGYNGLCRYNLDRKYSVPWGHRDKLNIDVARIDYLSFRLSAIELKTCGFEDTLATAGEGDQIYCDPPYDKIKKGSFVSYDGVPFDQNAHIRLADMLVGAHDKGATVAISNSKTPFTLELYEDRGFKIYDHNAYRSVGGSGRSRKKEEEILAVLN